MSICEKAFCLFGAHVCIEKAYTSLYTMFYGFSGSTGEQLPYHGGEVFVPLWTWGLYCAEPCAPGRFSQGKGSSGERPGQRGFQKTPWTTNEEVKWPCPEEAWRPCPEPEERELGLGLDGTTALWPSALIRLVCSHVWGSWIEDKHVNLRPWLLAGNWWIAHLE